MFDLIDSKGFVNEFFDENNRITFSICQNPLFFFAKKRKFFSAIKKIPASCYVSKGQLLQYFRRNNLSQPCSEWNGVVPLCYRH